jgi:hypothetical protein
MSATTIQIQRLIENSLWRRRRYWTECARPRAQQGWKDGVRRFFECAGNAHTAAPGTGALRRRTFQTGFQFNAETRRNAETPRFICFFCAVGNLFPLREPLRSPRLRVSEANFFQNRP